MHTEHLQNVRATRVAAGWLVAVAVTSLAALVAVGFQLVDAAAQFSTTWSLATVIVGFFAGGFFAGFRAIQAPILHGIAIGLASLVVWVVVNAIASVAFGALEWAGLTAGLAVALVLAQMVAAVIGALMGYNIALRGKPGLSEHEPLAE